MLPIIYSQYCLLIASRWPMPVTWAKPMLWATMGRMGCGPLCLGPVPMKRKGRPWHGLGPCHGHRQTIGKQ